MTEFGNLALIDQDAGAEDGVAIPLPGVKKGERRTPRVSRGPGRSRLRCPPPLPA